MLDADFEVERRDFTVRADLAGRPRRTTGVIRAIGCGQDDSARGDRRPGAT